MSFIIRHACGRVVDSITLPSVDALWTEKQFTDNHGKESQSRRGTFRLWRDDTDTRLVVLSMISKIPDGDPHNRCFHFVVQVQKPGAGSCAEPTLSYYDSNTMELVPEGRFAMASKTPDEVAGKSKRAGGAVPAGIAAADTGTAGTGTKKHTPAADRARHKGASTHAKKPRSAATITTPSWSISARGDSGSAFASYVPGATRPKPKSKKSATASGGQARSSRTTRRVGKHTGTNASALSPRCPRPHNQPNDLQPSPQDTTIAFDEDAALLAEDSCLVVTDPHHVDEGAWGTTCSLPLSVSVHASDETLPAHGGDDADAEDDEEAEMVGLTQMSHDSANTGNDSMYSPVWSDASRPSSSASATGNASSVLSTNSVDSTYMLGAPHYTADATPGPVSLMQQVTRGLQHLPPAPPLPPPLLSFGARDVADTAAATQCRLPQPIGFALPMRSSEFAPADSDGKSDRDHAADGHDRMHEDKLAIQDGSAARMLAANTPMAVAIEAGGVDGTSGSHSRRSSLDMALCNDNSCSSWCDMDDDEQGGGAAEDSPHYSAVLHGTPMAISLAAPLSSSGLLH